MAATSPTSDAVLGLFRACLLLTQPNAHHRLLSVGAILCISLFAWAGVISVVCPFSPSEILRNTIKAGAMNALGSPTVLRSLHHIWILDPAKPLLGVPFVVMFLFLFQRASVVRKPRADWFAAMVVVGALTYCVFQLSVRHATIYNLIGLYPACFAWATGEVFRKTIEARGRFRHALQVAAVAFWLVAPMGFIRQSLLLGRYRAEGITLAYGRFKLLSFSVAFGRMNVSASPLGGMHR